MRRVASIDGYAVRADSRLQPFNGRVQVCALSRTVCAHASAKTQTQNAPIKHKAAKPNDAKDGDGRGHFLSTTYSRKSCVLPWRSGACIWAELQERAFRRLVVASELRSRFCAREQNRCGAPNYEP